jgi:methyl-accepting chemotaxis protein
MAEITSASSEQRAGIDQVNIAITEMDAVTQQNAALVEQAAAAAASMQEQAAKLAGVAASFNLGNEGRAPAPAIAARPAPAKLKAQPKQAAPAARRLAAAKPAAPAKAAAPKPATVGAEHDWEEF